MSFLADFHIHSHFSIATSKDCDPEHLFLWACLKGIALVGTGDFTHPGWIEELSEKLIPAEDGLFKLKSKYEIPVLDQIPKSCHQDVRFILSSEISSIYKKGGKTRKVHNCILVPTMEEAKAISKDLETIGNIRADGRPILGLDSRNLLEIMLDAAPDGIFIPAHIWTPHFSLFGAYSGFDTLEECFDDLSEHIWAVETGLSSDPPMNWRLSALDQYTLVSNSDAHSPKNLAREANILDCELSFQAIRSAIKYKGKGQFLGTVEFFPQEGKYHYNGHRNCSIRLTPEETAELNGICPKCGKALTLGVMHRVAELADRPYGFIPNGAPFYKSLIPLPEILSDYFGCGKNSKKVDQTYFDLIQRFGSEWKILTIIPVEELKSRTGLTLAEGINRVRKGKVTIKPGFDGEYGTISVFSPEERRGEKIQISLFARLDDLPCTSKKSPPSPAHIEKTCTDRGINISDQAILPLDQDQTKQCATQNKQRHDQLRHNVQDLQKEEIFTHELNSEQIKAVKTLPEGPVLVIAGPGTGKTRTLVYRMAYLIKKCIISPDEIIAITFTNKAAKEMKQRLESVIHPALSSSPFIGTFHQYCLTTLKRYGPNPEFTLFHTYDSLGLIGHILDNRKEKAPFKTRECMQKISILKVNSHAASGTVKNGNDYIPADNHPISGLKQEKNQISENIDDRFLLTIYKEYQKALDAYNAYDYDDLLIKTVELLKKDETIAIELKTKYSHILIDEFQDVNPIQYYLIKLLADEKGKGLFIIGDPNQAIYGFRGADNSLFFRIREEFKGTQIHTLELNYRTTAKIIESALSVISNNHQPAPLKLKSTRGSGSCIQILEHSSEKAEGIAIVKEITKLMGGIDMLQAHDETGKGYCKTEGDTTIRKTRDTYSFSDFAILFRTGNQADILEECLLKEGIPYQVIGQQRIMEKPIVRQIFALMRWSHHPDNEYSLMEGLNLPVFPKTQKKDMNHLKSDPESESLLNTLNRYRHIAIENPPAKFLEVIISDILKQNSIIGNDKDLKRLNLLAEEFQDISSLLDNVSLYREGDISWKGLKRDNKDTEMVSLMTLHAAKGLEFPVIFICGCEDGLLPYRHHYKDYQKNDIGKIEEIICNENKDNINEERRIFYVGMTRARDYLYLSWAKNLMIYGKKRKTAISPFLEEIPSTNYQKISFTSKSQQKPKIRQLSLWNSNKGLVCF